MADSSEPWAVRMTTAIPGQRQRIVSNVRPGLITRLNSGIYYIVSRLGDANALVSADVAVEADEQTELGLVLDFAFDDGTGGMGLRESFPRIFQRLLEAERNTALGRIDLEDDDFDFLRRGQDLARMDVLLGPRHFRDVHEALDTGLRGDFYTSLAAIDADGITVDVFWFPFIWLVWAGGFLAAAGGVWAWLVPPLRRTAPLCASRISLGRR